MFSKVNGLYSKIHDGPVMTKATELKAPPLSVMFMKEKNYAKYLSSRPLKPQPWRASSFAIS